MAIPALLLSIPSQQVMAQFSVDTRTMLSWIQRFKKQGIAASMGAPAPDGPEKSSPNNSNHT